VVLIAIIALDIAIIATESHLSTAHNPKVSGSNPDPATNKPLQNAGNGILRGSFFPSILLQDYQIPPKTP
jgi:hypothetical protein